MSNNNTRETEELVIKLLQKLERKGKNILLFLWKLMDQFEDDQFDEKNEEKKFNIDNNKITLLYDEASNHVCKVGHLINTKYQKHLSIDPCIICAHGNTNNKQNKVTPNSKQILQFLHNYNTKKIPFELVENQTGEIKAWVTKGKDKKWPLHYAAITGDLVTINQLCKNKTIDVDQKRTDWSDKTPITIAARYGQLESLIELMKNGANLMEPPDESNQTPYQSAVTYKHKSITLFFEEYIKYLYDFDINNNTNLECYSCYNYDLQFNKHMINGTMSKYVYCKNCTMENAKNVKKKQTNNLIIERRIIKTIRENPSISVDTLCQMKDVKSLHSILKEIMVSGRKYGYWLWLLNIDNFKAINTHLTHAIADTKIQALGQILKKLEANTWRQWRNNGYDGIYKIYAFRQGGDEFALVIGCAATKKNILQKLYERLRNNISKIKLENMEMKHLTVSIGVCNGQGIDNYDEMMKKAEDAAEMVQQGGKNGIAISFPFRKKIYKNFNEI